MSSLRHMTRIIYLQLEDNIVKANVYYTEICLIFGIIE
jgi:hypothetical protein